MVFSVFLIAGLLVVTAIALDFGHINVSRSELKRAADAAAMSACWELFDGVVEGKNVSAVETEIGVAASSFAAKNVVSSAAPTLNAASDIEIGYYDQSNPGHLDQSDPSQFNAVRVHLRQTDANGSAIPLFFGSVTGRSTQSLKTHATAALFKTISGFHSPGNSGEMLDILPIALDLETWEKVVAKNTEDVLCYQDDGSIVSGTDGYYECSLYPVGNGSPGNRGTVDIGSNNNSTSDISRQICHGISAQDLAGLGRPLEMDANSICKLNGDTGISAAIKDDLQSIVGQIRCMPIFESVSGNGDNAMYSICRWEGVRILSVRLTGPAHKKHLTIQPAPMIAKYAKFNNPSVTESSFLFTPVMLVE
jgi:hypothetical protein